MRTAVKRKVGYVEDTFGTAYKSTIWSECTSGTGAVSIASGELKLNCPANNDIAALVTKVPYYIRNARLTVDVDVATDSPARGGIVIAKTKTTNSNPEAENDMISLCLDQVNDKVLCITDVGGTEKTVLNAAWTDGDGTVQIDIEPDGFTTLYEDTTSGAVISNPLTATPTPDIFNLYIYIYCIGLTGTLGYGLFDNFRLDMDLAPNNEIQGTGVRAAQLMETTPIIGRLVDFGTADTFETDQPYTATPTQRIVLSRDVKRFRLEEIRAYFDSANNATSGIALYEDAQAGDVRSYSHMPYKTGDNTSIADATAYIKTINDTPLPVTFNLERPGQVWFVQDYSAAPGNTTGYLILVGKEVM